MAKKDRTGNRKTREQRKQFKVPELGYYLIVTDTEATERCFFTGLNQALPENVRNKLVIKVVETKTRAMIDKYLELTAYDAQYRIPWIVFDRDQVQGFDEIISEAVSKGIQVGWSNPCFEIWMYAYFGSMPAIQDSWACCSDLGRVYETKTGQKYSKADEQMYGRICKVGDEEKAIQIAQQKLEQCKREGKAKPSEINKLNVIYGDGSKKFILEDADAASCQVAIALTESDETNLIICEMCKEFFHVEKTVSMLNDPSKTDFFYQMGIDRVVCALNMITNIMEENALMDEMMKMIPLEEGRLHIAETAILHNSALIGKKLWELNLPKEIIIGCILRGDQSLIPRGDTNVKEGDILLMITSDKQKLNAVKELTKN